MVPPPYSGQILVKKRYRCAASSPVACLKAAAGDAMTKVISSITYGKYFAEKETTK